MYYYSPSNNGFYVDSIHGDAIPADAIEVTEEQYRTLLDGLNAGKVLTVGVGNALILNNQPVDLALAKKHCHAIIDTLRSQAMKSGFEYDGHTYQADPVSYGNLTSAIVAANSGNPLPDGFTWRTADDQNIAVTTEDLVAMGTAALTYITECYQRSWDLKAGVDTAIAAIDTADQVQAIKDSIIW